MPAAVISGFAPGDSIDLSSVKWDPRGTVQMLAGNVLRVVENGASYLLNFDPHQKLPDFQLTANPTDGSTVITEAGASSKGIAVVINPKAGGMPSTDLLTQHMATSFASPGPVTTDAVGGGLANHPADAASGLAPPRASHVLM
jgi:hypothetical protein